MLGREIEVPLDVEVAMSDAPAFRVKTMPWLLQQRLATTHEVAREGFDTWIKYSNYCGHTVSGHLNCNI